MGGRGRQDLSALTYILPIRRAGNAAPPDELTSYLARVAGRAQLVIVDGSDAETFAHNARAWSAFATHCPVDADVDGINGKVRGVLSGLRRAAHERVIIADDDIRYGDDVLDAVAAQLDHSHVVLPQNYFAPLPWHARWDTGRILLNRAADGDWPGTLAVRRSALEATNGYDADVLFENFELVQTIVAAGGRSTRADDLFVRRIPPTSAHFSGQRVRQAYDELARPARLLVQLALLPLLAALSWLIGLQAIAAFALATIAVAEFGRRRRGGASVFPASASLYAPAWLSERAVCVWLALAQRITRGGVSYAGRIVKRAATPRAVLRRRYAGAIDTSTSIGLNEPLFESSAEQAVTPTMRSISARTTM